MALLQLAGRTSVAGCCMPVLQKAAGKARKDIKMSWESRVFITDIKAGCFPDVWKEWKKAVLVYTGPQFRLQSTLPRTSGKNCRGQLVFTNHSCFKRSIIINLLGYDKMDGTCSIYQNLLFPNCFVVTVRLWCKWWNCTISQPRTSWGAAL